ncbi:MAG: hypothetical protein E6R13_05370 [Spirochaetes bacterium]|nr:MAG: hypothetical protein E6R13_05370 [Spirochaetota bacterium]
MGQFYRGTEATFLDDAMYKAPHELMGQAIAKKDKEIGDTVNSLTAYYDKLTADTLEEDNPNARKIIEETRKRIDSAISGVLSDPMNYSVYLPEMKSIGRNIQTDWSSAGRIGTMEGYKKSYTEEVKKIDERVKANTLRPEMAEAEKRKIRAQYAAEGGLKWDETNQKALNGLAIQSQYYDVNLNEDFLKQMKPSEYTREYDTASGRYFYRHKSTNKTLSEQDIYRAYQAQMNADTTLLYGAARASTLGRNGGDLEGYEGVSDFDKALTASKDKKGNTFYEPNMENYWGRKMKAAAETFKQSVIDISDTQRGNEVAISDYNYERDNEDSDIISDVETAIGVKIVSANSSAATFRQNASKYINLRNEMAGAIHAADPKLKKNNPKLFALIHSGDPAAIKEFFKASPELADKYIARYQTTTMERNLQQGAIINFNKVNKTNLPSDPTKWNKQQQETWNKFNVANEAVNMNKGTASFNNLLEKKDREFYQKAYTSRILEGNGTFESMEGLPSEKLKGGKVRYLDQNNNAYKSLIDPNRNVEVTYKGKIYYFPQKVLNTEHKYKIGKEVVTVKPQDVMVTYGVPAPVGLPYYAQQGHIKQKYVVSTEEEGTPTNKLVYAYNNGRSEVEIKLDQNNVRPAWDLNNKKENYTEGALNIGGHVARIKTSEREFSTPAVSRAWNQNYEQRNIDNTYLKYGGRENVHLTAKGVDGSVYELKNGKYTVTKEGKTMEILNKDAILEADKTLLYQNK